MPLIAVVHDAHALLDVPRVLADQQRLQILHRADHRPGLPFEGRLAPAIEPGLVGLDPHEDPVAHLGIDHAVADPGDAHGGRVRSVAGYIRSIADFIR
jgi:hypothetical protein